MIKPINGNIFLKLDVNPIEKTKSGIVYDTTFRKTTISYGYVHTITDEQSKKYNIRIGDRVAFQKDRCEQITFKSKRDLRLIDYVLIVIHPKDVLGIINQNRSVLDMLG